MAVWFNEFHYDNTGTDSGERIELAGDAGTDLSGWSIVLYNGSGGAPYQTIALTGLVIPDQSNGLGTVATPPLASNAIQNGAPDGFALVDNTGAVVQFLSYEGSFTAVGGPANGMTSTNIGVSETGSEPVGLSLQLTGTGRSYEDFSWSVPTTQNFGSVNAGQSFSDEPPPPPPPVPEVAIYDIQGAGHRSALEGEKVTTIGIVTAVDSNGFYIQDATGDGKVETSDAIFVFTGSRPTVALGNEVAVTGTVSEFQPGGASSHNLTSTQLTSPTTEVLSTGNALPDAVVIGADGRTPPSEVIDDDNFTVFDPAQDGIDFYESLEGMRVTVSDVVAVAPTSRFGEIYGVVDGGAAATGLSERGTINIDGSYLGEAGLDVTNVRSDGADFNPERVQIQVDSGILPGQRVPEVDTGDRLNDVTGVVSYGFGNYEILATTPVTVKEDGGLARETTSLDGGEDAITVATYNVLNLDPKVESSGEIDDDVGDGRFAQIARDIVANLKTPEIVALQEIQDNDGGENTSVTSASETLQLLIDAIVEAGGPRYVAIDNPFVVDDQSGGQPGGNIRNAFLYDPARVSLVEGSVRTLQDDAFDGTRLPLIADFRFEDEVVTVVNNHFSSKGGSTPLFGDVQPATNGSEDQRLAQAEAVNAFVDRVLANDPDAQIVVAGDHNEFEFEEPMQVLEGEDEVLNNLTFTLPEDERYSYIFEGNSQSLDHILVSDSLVGGAALDAVHVNSEFSEQASDHDPLLAALAFDEGVDVALLRLSGHGGRDGNGAFRVVYEVTNTGDEALTDWELDFDLSEGRFLAGNTVGAKTRFDRGEGAFETSNRKAGHLDPGETFKVGLVVKGAEYESDLLSFDFARLDQQHEIIA